MSPTTMKWTKRAVICFYVLVIAGLALYDEEPAPELARQMAKPLPEIVEPGNAWVVFSGFNAPHGMSPYFRGEEKMKKLLGGKTGRDSLPLDNDEKTGLQFKGKIPSFSGSKDNGMLAFAEKHRDEVVTLSRDNEELLERYERLMQFTRYNEPVAYGFFAPVPSYLPIKQACVTNLLQLACKACQGDTESAMERVRKDAEFWRLISRSSNTLISKCVAIAILRFHLRLAADLGGSGRLSDKDLAIVGDVLRPFDKGEMSFVGSLRGEMRYGLQSLRLVRSEAKWWDMIAHLCKPNATENRFYEDWQRSGSLQLAEMTSPQFALEQKKKGVGDLEGTRRIGIPFLYNPLGEIMAFRNAGNFPYYSAYVTIGHDMEGFRRLSCLKVLSRTEHIPREGMQKFLESHKTELGNPYTGDPMIWNPEKSSISFATFDGQRAVEIFL